MADLPTKSRVKLEQKFTPLPRQQEVQRVGKRESQSRGGLMPTGSIYMEPRAGQGAEPFPTPWPAQRGSQSCSGLWVLSWECWIPSGASWLGWVNATA